MVRVTNLANGRSTTVRINDRGPFSKDRIIDLSKKAAQEIGMIQTGTARVRIEAITPKTSRRTLSRVGRRPPGHGNTGKGQRFHGSAGAGRPRAGPHLYSGRSFSSPANSRHAAATLKELGISGRVRTSGGRQIVQARGRSAPGGSARGHAKPEFPLFGPVHGGGVNGAAPALLCSSEAGRRRKRRSGNLFRAENAPGIGRRETRLRAPCPQSALR